MNFSVHFEGLKLIYLKMASCGVEIDEEVLNMNSPEMQVLKNSLKDKNMRLGIEQMLKAMVKLMPQNLEDQAVSKSGFFRCCGSFF